MAPSGTSAMESPLHARELEIDHPTQNKPMTFVAPLPGYWLTEPGFARLF